MSALPNRQLPVSQPETEVIYVVVPTTIDLQPVLPSPSSLVERVSLMLYTFPIGSQAARDKGLALAFAFFLTLVIGLWAYNVKSAFGIDIFPHQHIENFGPSPGWQR